VKKKVCLLPDVGRLTFGAVVVAATSTATRGTVAVCVGADCGELPLDGARSDLRVEATFRP